MASPNQKRGPSGGCKTTKPGKSGQGAHSFEQNLLRLGDTEESREMLREQVRLEFELANPEWACLNREIPGLDVEYTASCKRLDRLNRRVDDTPESTPVHVDEEGNPVKSVAFSDWLLSHRIGFVLSLVGCVVMLLVSASNIYSILLDSGSAVFIERPMIALSLSLLAPAGSLILKYFHGFFVFNSAKRRFTLGVFTLAALVFLAWILTFALSYSAVGTGIDWSALGEDDGNNLGALLVLLQMAAEILIGGALALAANDIANEYAPDLFRKSLAHLDAVKSLDAYTPTHEALHTRWLDAHMRRDTLQSECEALIRERLVAYRAELARLQTLTSL